MSDQLQILNSSLQEVGNGNYSYDQLLEKLTPIINNLLDRDMNSLMSILYRIDVSESKFREVLATSEPHLVGENVARLILDRQIQKIETRKKYR